MPTSAMMAMPTAERTNGNTRESSKISHARCPTYPNTPRRAENDEHPPLQEHGEHDKREADEPVEEPVDLAAAFEQREPTPERQHAGEVAPEGVVLLRAAVDQVRADQDREPEEERDQLVPIPVVIRPVDERREVHAHEPEGEGDRGGKEREPEEPQRNESRHHGADLHGKPAALDPAVEVPVLAWHSLQL